MPPLAELRVVGVKHCPEDASNEMSIPTTTLSFRARRAGSITTRLGRCPRLPPRLVVLLEATRLVRAVALRATATSLSVDYSVSVGQSVGRMRRDGAAELCVLPRC